MPTKRSTEHRPLQPLEDQQRQEWRDWIAEMAVRAKYAKYIGPRGANGYRLYIEELARESHIIEETLSQIIRSGGTPTIETAQRLAAALGLNPFSLIYRARLISPRRMAQFLGPAGYALMTSQRFDEEFGILERSFGLFNQPVPEYLLRQLEDQLGATKALQHDLGRSDAEWATLMDSLDTELAREQVRSEIVASSESIPCPSIPAELASSVRMAEPKGSVAWLPGPRKRMLREERDDEVVDADSEPDTN